MHSPGLTARIFIGMLIGVLVGLALIKVAPTGIQPGDRLRVVMAASDSFDISVASEDRERRTADLMIDGVRREAVFEDGIRRGSARMPDGQEVRLAGLNKARARQVIEKAAGAEVESVDIAHRTSVTVLPRPTQVAYIVGEFFIRLLKMLIIPLIVSTVFVGIASLGSVKTIGSIGLQAMGVYVATATFAVILGLLIVNMISPGTGLDWSAPESASAAVTEVPNLPDLILRLVPVNPIEAMVKFDVLGMLFFTIVLALAMLAAPGEHTRPVLQFFHGVADLVYVVVDWLMLIAPVGVGALVAYFVGIQDPRYLGSLVEGVGKFALCVVIGLIVHFAILTLLTVVFGRCPAGELLRKSMPALVTAFGTASSNATLPVTFSSIEDLRVSRRVYGFVAPVGATVNMDGTAIYEAVAALFFAQAFGIDLSFGQQAVIALTAMLAAVGAAGIPSAGLVTMTLVLTAVGLPLAGIGLLFAIDRPLDMLRTVVNVYGDICCSRIVQTWNPSVRQEDDEQ